MEYRYLLGYMFLVFYISLTYSSGLRPEPDSNHTGFFTSYSFETKVTGDFNVNMDSVYDMLQLHLFHSLPDFKRLTAYSAQC